MMDRRERMRDAAFAANIAEPWNRAVAGYYGGPNAFHVWSSGDWKRFPRNPQLPIWVAGVDGAGEGDDPVRPLRALSGPRRVYTAVDLEPRGAKTYLEHFCQTLNPAASRLC